MELSSTNNYKRMGLNWIHNGTQLLPLQHYSLALKIAKQFEKHGEDTFTEKNIL